MRVAITGTTSGLGKQLKEILELEHTIIPINRDKFENLSTVDLTGVDLLINNAGHSLGGGKGFSGHSYSQWQSIIDVNLVAPMLLTQQFVNQNTKGSIVFITSKAVEKFIGGDSVYTASKTGLSAFIDCIRDEHKDSEFKFIEVRPGRIKTSFAANRQIHKDNAKNFYDHVPHMSAEEVANVILFAMKSNIVEKITVSR